MKIRAWRISRRERVKDAFTGEGARLYGGRWNSPGTSLIYASDSLALAALEALVPINPQIPLAQACFELVFDSRLVAMLNGVPKGWNQHPPPPLAQRMGDEWVKSGRTAVLAVPSVLVPSQHTYLFNPKHPDFPKITIGPMRPFPFDPRLI